MLRIFLQDIPSRFSPYPPENQKGAFNGVLVRRLRNQIASAACCTSDGVEIHLSFQDHGILADTGKVEQCLNVHGFVLWHGKEIRNSEVKHEIANALQYYLNQYEVGKGFDLTFMDMPAGSFFVEQDGVSVMVAGGELLPPFNQIAYVVGEHTGFGREE